MSPPVTEVDVPAAKHAPPRAPVPAKPNNPMLGAALMTLAAALFAGLNGLVKYASNLGLDPLQISFLRSIFAAGAMMPFLIRPILANGFAYLKPVRPGLMLFRGLSASIGVMLWMTAVTMLPLAEVTAISFTAPLFATIGSALLLGEIVRARRWSAIAIGFVGVLIILRPGMIPLETGVFWAIGAAGGMAVAALVIKLLTRTEPADRIVFWTNVILTFGTLGPALWVWQPMTMEMWLVGIAMGAVGAISHIFLTNAFAVADASIVLPFDYTRLPFVAVVGFFAFGETSDLVTWLGAGLIAASAFYVARREQLIAKKAQSAART